MPELPDVAIYREALERFVGGEVLRGVRLGSPFAQGEAALAGHDPGGLEVLEVGLEAFRERLLSENHTLKRSLTDPRIFSGIGNAYSDEILHRARLSPMKWSTRLSGDETERLFAAARDTLTVWIDRLRADVGDDFPEKVTAFHAENEANYCATCQTGGKLLKDRALSPILKDDWPRTVEGWEDLKGA